ncbi:MAG TPA: hypothetical protein VNI84_09835 [Pyrinomonadaceae bacterium]|nr:hypothetical protein [Pyrinomonadaceae bacterium]
MSRIVVDLQEPEKVETETTQTENSPEFGDYQKPKQRSGFYKFLNGLGIFLVAILIAGAIGGYFYWRYLKTTPQYSLGLLIDAARRDDQKAIDELVDADAIVDNFMPQITDKAVELYGRGVSPATIARAEQVAAPVLPAIKIRARAEIPDLIRDKTQKFNRVPFWAIALGASRYVEITNEDDKAFINSKLPENPLSLTLKRNGDKWQVVGVKDEELAKNIAGKIGQQIISAATKGGVNKAGEQLGVGNLTDLIKELDGIFK